MTEGDHRDTGPVGASLPDSLVRDHARLVQGRSAASRVLARGRARRRLLPPLVVGSGALLGSSVIAAWVFGQEPPATSATTATATTAAPPVPTASPDQGQLGADVVALNRLRQALAADEAAITGLASATSGATGRTATPGPASGTTGAAPAGSAPRASGSGGTSSPAAGGAPAPGGTGVAPLAPLPTLPPLPSLPAVTTPPTTAPPTHTTTGASVAAP